MLNSPRLQIAVEGLPEEGTILEGEVSFADLDIEEDSHISLPHPLLYKLHVSPVKEKVLVQGELKALVRCRCDRCLTYFDLPVSTTDVCHYVDVPANRIVDLTEGVREDILMAFPQRCLCQADCRGLCPTCGQNLNVRECSCPPPETDISAWDVLSELDLPEESEE